ncbi:MAG TPA: hypothetical protein VJ124_15345 [Pyrinomonadaceae bacterium]|nr:hypothetical protein [Pyrinomonadaceae bacterium]
MRRLNGSRLLRMSVLSIIVSLGLPATAFAQRRGWGRDRSHERFSKKCAKFVNCHDARDGRWDGRGPRRRFSDDTVYRRRRHRRDDDFYRRRYRQRYEDSFYRRRERQRYRYDNYDRNDYYRNGYGNGFNLADLLQIFNP